MMQEHYETFVADVEHAAQGAAPPQFIKDEFGAYLDCGILAHGCMRLTSRVARAIRWWRSVASGAASVCRAAWLKLIAAIEGPAATERILTHLGLAA
ncbi:MAG TPA: hypothetical protein VK663_14565 [Burkholderiales bacterium]|nr:hypothetical protein [Burkholderiales bacterium]